MLNIRSLIHEIREKEGVTELDVFCEELYPAVIDRIQEVLDGANPLEVLATSERGGTARADILIANARALPAQAWKDALRPRDEFTSVSYAMVADKQGKPRDDLLGMFSLESQKEVTRMIQRGTALEIALGWFLHAARLEFGAINTTINSRDDSKPFRL